MYKQSVTNLMTTNDYRVLLEELKKYKPLSTMYNPITNNIEELKFNSAKQQMYDVIMLIMNPKNK